MARAAAPASGAPAMPSRQRASPASSSSPMGQWGHRLCSRSRCLRYMIFSVTPRKRGPRGERRGPGALGSCFRGNDEIKARAIGDGLGRAARMGGEEPARHHQGRRSPEDVLNSRMIAYLFRLIAVLPGDRWRRRIDPDRRRTRQRLPAKARVYLLGTGESVETSMVSKMEDFTPRKPSASPAPRPLTKPASPTTTSTI